MKARPHDLLFLRSPHAVQAPAWCDADWMARAPVVVRRAVAVPGSIPVGLRGRQRSQRSAATVAAEEVVRSVAPEALRADLPAAGGLHCIEALGELAPRLDALGLEWGPAGGVGFWLACGLPVLRPDSDLDLLVRAPAPLAPSIVEALSGLQAVSPCRIDIQVDTGSGGFALAEYARGGRVLLKTAQGPLLVDDPWQRREAA
jgi:phosphoribosyl-dephospho-CoA transferase